MDYDMNSYSLQQSYNMFPYPNHFFGNNVCNKSTCDTKNRFVYINQDFINANGPIGTKVLINPNFKQTVHINPNFKKPTKHSIHVNPNILKLTDAKSVINLNVENNFKEKINFALTTNSKPIISTKTKLVRAETGVKPQYDIKPERRKSLHSKYKIVHAKENSSKSKSVTEKNYLKNKYKIDKNILKVKKSPTKIYAKSKYRLQNVSPNRQKNVFLKGVLQKNSKYMNINGILYKKTPNVLKKADVVKMTYGEANLNKSKVLLRRGKVYKLDHRCKTLKVFPLTVNSSSRKYIKRNSNGISREPKLNLSMKLINGKKKLFLSDTKNVTKQILINKMKKCNLPCPIYRRFGKCKAKELGKCIRVHNPNQIMMCTKFLQGACIDSNCPLSHRVSAEKMPTCKYFLEGICTREDCVYLHVKINAKADICRDFVEGFCEKAKECNNRHQFLCPDYEKNGYCPRKRCRYPHGTTVRQTKFLNKVAKRMTKKRNCNKTVKIKVTNDGKENEIDINVRYYTETSEGNQIKNTDDVFEDNQDNIKCDSVNDIENNKQSKLTMLKRAQLGVLPSYIPLGLGHPNMIENNM